MNLFYKAKIEEKDVFKCLMVYCNTPLSNTLQSPMQILSNISTRSDLPISDAARKHLGIDCEDLRTKYKNEHLPSHDPYIDQTVMYQDSTSKWSYIITTKDSVQYRKMQAPLKPYQPQGKKSEDEHLSQSNHMWMVKIVSTKSHKIDSLA